MNRFASALLGVLVMVSSPSWAVCKEGQTKQCIVKGKKATMECISGRWAKCGSETAMSVPEASNSAVR